MKRILQLLTVALLLAHAGTAQRQQRFPTKPPKTILLGTVYDKYHSVMSRAHVVARDIDGEDYEATTNAEGVYSLQVPAGIYKIEANAEGFCPRRANNFNAIIGVLDFVLVVRDGMKPCKQRSMLKQPQKRPPDILRGITE